MLDVGLSESQEAYFFIKVIYKITYLNGKIYITN